MDRQRIFWFFFIFFCHNKIIAANNSAVNEECSSSDLNDRVSKLEFKNSHHEEEISVLKSTVHQLRDRVATIEAKESTRDDATSGQAKRPARLLPLHLFW